MSSRFHGFDSVCESGHSLPGRSVVDMSVDTMARLFKLKNIVGVKDARAEYEHPVRLGHLAAVDQPRCAAQLGLHEGGEELLDHRPPGLRRQHAAGDDAVTRGRHEGAVRYPFNDPGAGLTLSGESRGCNQSSGNFDVIEVAYAPDGAVERTRARGR